jgi:hypothetical protein
MTELADGQLLTIGWIRRLVRTTGGWMTAVRAREY